MSRIFLTVILVLGTACFVCEAQPPTAEFDYVYPYTDGLRPPEYAERRQKISDALPDSSALIIFSNDHIFPWIDNEYKRNNDLFFLTGINDEKVKFLLLSHEFEWEGDTYKEAVFIPEQSENDKIWNGVKMSMDFAEDKLEIEHVLYNSDYEDFGSALFPELKVLYIGLDRRAVHYLKQYRDSFEFIRQITEKYPKLEIKFQVPEIKSLRMIKSESEINLIQKAVDISMEAHRQAISNTVQGMFEYEIRAIMEYNFEKLGSEKPAYTSIVAAGNNTCILHYTGTRTKTKDGDLVLMDCGAEYHGYASDITRTFPVNGKFSEEQRAVYDVVLEALDSAISACKPGKTFNAPHNISKKVLIRGLLKLGIIKNESEIDNYFFHSANHYLGLFVHDCGDYGKLMPGTVLAVEPGVYIPEGSPCDKKWWNIGIRIEDNILITETGNINLSEKLEKKAEDIEKLMRK